MSRPTLHLLVDGSAGVGVGHLGRSLALAHAWVGASGAARLLDEPVHEGWVDRYRSAGVEVGPGPERPDVVLVDGYHVADATVAARGGGAPVASIDDHRTSGRTVADLVVDQNLGAEPGRYGSPVAGVLAGPRYALLRPEVVDRRPAEVDRTVPPRRLLVALGGDPPASALAAFDAAAAVVAERHGLEVVPLRGVRDVGAVLSRVDLALSASGSTVWELALHGIPSVVVAIAANQEPVARRLGRDGVAVDAGDLHDLDADRLVAALSALIGDPARRQRLAEEARGLVDGRGARRVGAAVRSLMVHLRPAGPEDARLLWGWANDPAVRGNAFTPDPIGWEEHLAWFERSRARATARQWIGRDGAGVPIGQVRIDLDAGVGTVDLSVAAERRGEGWAAALLVAAARAAVADLGPLGLRSLAAAVLPGNAASARAFVAADFDRGPDGSTGGREHETYTRACHG